jgi:putative ABC transport system permease protein
VVSRSFAARFWPGQEPLGRHFQFGLHDRVVVGVAGDVRVRGLERTSEPQVYLPHQQVPDGWLLFYSPRALVVRTAAGVAAPLPAIRRIIRAADPLQPISDVRPLADVVAAETAPRTVQVRVLAALAGVAFLLAGIGIHGLLSFAVSQRGGEIGVRMALGATAPDILGLVLRRGALLGAAGILPGTLAAYAGGRAMAALLAGVEPGDAATFLAAGGLCLLMTLTGSLLPALRASRVDPAAVMRGE